MWDLGCSIHCEWLRGVCSIYPLRVVAKSLFYLSTAKWFVLFLCENKCYYLSVGVMLYIAHVSVLLAEFLYWDIVSRNEVIPRKRRHLSRRYPRDRDSQVMPSDNLPPWEPESQVYRPQIICLSSIIQKHSSFIYFQHSHCCSIIWKRVGFLKECYVLILIVAWGDRMQEISRNVGDIHCHQVTIYVLQ